MGTTKENAFGYTEKHNVFYLQIANTYVNRDGWRE